MKASQRRYEEKPERKAYVREYYKQNYKQIHFYRVLSNDSYPSINGSVDLTTKDELYFPSGHKRWLNCPSKNLVGILIPSIELYRAKRLERKKLCP